LTKDTFGPAFKSTAGKVISISFVTIGCFCGLASCCGCFDSSLALGSVVSIIESVASFFKAICCTEATENPEQRKAKMLIPIILQTVGVICDSTVNFAFFFDVYESGTSKDDKYVFLALAITEMVLFIVSMGFMLKIYWST